MRQDGVFYAETQRVLPARTRRGGLLRSGATINPTVTDIIIRATHTQEVLGEQGRRIRELTSLIQKRFKFPEGTVSLYAARSRTAASPPSRSASRCATSY